ncbi:MAG: metal-dependent hydrolase [Rhodospirillales bacterium]|nr:metal-dependent hydrolase [Rhodospirillales bacterium]
MLIFGHLGITLGAAVLLNGALIKSGVMPANQGQPDQDIEAPSPQEQRSLPLGKWSWITSLGRRIDIRILLVGSLLPDIIDKPVGQLLLRETLDNGRLFCHTLLFLIILTLLGAYVYRKTRGNWLLVLSGGVFAHLALDQIWRTPRTLFWPLYGWAFERLVDLTRWLRGIWYALFTEPSVYIPELTGIAVLVWFTIALLTRRKLCSFVTTGRF